MIARAAAAVAQLADPGTAAADCCVYARDVLLHAYTLERPTPEQHALWCVHPDPDGTVPRSRVWGPTVAAAEAGIAVAITSDPQIGRWHLCQGWRSLRPDGRANPQMGDRGHTWLWYAADAGVGVVIDSARERGARVVGWQSWGRWMESYPAGIKAAVLRRFR